MRRRARPNPREFEYFASGTNEVGQIWGLARIGHPIGVAADQCLGRGGCEQALIQIAKDFPNQRVFVDSGAFSEVEFQPGKGLVVVRPISHEEWTRRLDFMKRIAHAYGDRALLIAPDLVGDQQATLERLARYREDIMWLDRMEAEVAVVLQRGELSPAEFEDQAIQVLGWGGFVRAFPMAKGATPVSELAAYLRKREPRRIHLLGVGPKARGNKKLGTAKASDLVDLFAKHPRVDVSWDSCLIAAGAARDVPGGRKLTRAQDVEASSVLAEALTQGVRDPYREVDYDWTEVEPSVYLDALWGGPAKTAAARKRYRAVALETAARAGLQGDEAESFIRDPDAFVHSRVDPDWKPGPLSARTSLMKRDAPDWEDQPERWEVDPQLATELERSFTDWVIESSAQLRKERSMVSAFAPGQEPQDPVTVHAPAIDRYSGRVIRGKTHASVSETDSEEALARFPRTRRNEALKRRLMR